MARTLEDTVRYLIQVIRTGGTAGQRLGDKMLELKDDVISKVVHAIRRGATEAEVLALLRTNMTEFHQETRQTATVLSIQAAETQTSQTARFLASLADVPVTGIRQPRITPTWISRVFNRPLLQQKISVADLIESSGLNIRQRATGIVRDAYFRGTTTQEISRIFRESADEAITDSTVRRNADAIARTATQTVANQARNNTFEANDDLVERILFVATLDHRTSDICMVTDGSVWKLGDPDALIPPLHVNCRSTVVPILEGESVKEVQADLDRPSVVPKSQEALEHQGLTTRTGRVRKPSRTDRSPLRGKIETKYRVYEDWLKAQPKYYQREILGKKAYERFQETGNLRQSLSVATL